MNRISTERPSWDEIWMKIVDVIAERSVCLFYKVAAVVVKSNQFLSAGYNGPPTGELHCIDVGCARRDEQGNLKTGTGECRGCHAELNVLVNALDKGIKDGFKGAVIYCSYSPCHLCAKELVNAGIREYIYKERYEQD